MAAGGAGATASKTLTGCAARRGPSVRGLRERTGEAFASPVRWVRRGENYMRSMMVLMPMPAPMHWVARP